MRPPIDARHGTDGWTRNARAAWRGAPYPEDSGTGMPRLVSRSYARTLRGQPPIIPAIMDFLALGVCNPLWSWVDDMPFPSYVDVPVVAVVKPPTAWEDAPFVF